MNSKFVALYLRFVAIALSVTALAKMPAIPAIASANLCMEDPMFGRFQHLSNGQVLALAAGTEFFIVALIFFSRRRWLPCLAAALWGSICIIARVYFMISGVNCGCLGWLAKPEPVTNIIATALALAIAAGGYKAFGIAWHDPGRFRNASPKAAG